MALSATPLSVVGSATALILNNVETAQSPSGPHLALTYSEETTGGVSIYATNDGRGVAVIGDTTVTCKKGSQAFKNPVEGIFSGGRTIQPKDFAIFNVYPISGQNAHQRALLAVADKWSCDLGLTYRRAGGPAKVAELALDTDSLRKVVFGIDPAHLPPEPIPKGP